MRHSTESWRKKQWSKNTNILFVWIFIEHRLVFQTYTVHTIGVSCCFVSKYRGQKGSQIKSLRTSKIKWQWILLRIVQNSGRSPGSIPIWCSLSLPRTATYPPGDDLRFPFSLEMARSKPLERRLRFDRLFLEMRMNATPGPLNFVKTQTLYQLAFTGDHQQNTRFTQVQWIFSVVSTPSDACVTASASPRDKYQRKWTPSYSYRRRAARFE